MPLMVVNMNQMHNVLYVTMAKHNAKSLLKRKQEIVNRIQKLQREIVILEREHREIINNLDLNKGNNNGQTEESESSL